MKTATHTAAYLERLNAVQKAWDSFDGDREEALRVSRDLETLRPRGYIAVHGDGSCRVIRGGEYLTPFQAVPEDEAVRIAHDERIQTDVRFRLTGHTWFSVSTSTHRHQ